MEGNFFYEGDQAITLKRIEDSLRKRLAVNHAEKGKKFIDNAVEEILSINGLNKERFDSLKTFKRFIDNRINDESVDDNSNKNEKTIAAIFNEVSAPHRKAVGFDYLYCKMREMYGKEEATRLSGLLYDYSLGISDSTAILIPYCYALDATRLVTEGRQFGTLQSKPCKRVASYISALCETIHQLSTHFAGAVAEGTFFFDLARIMLSNGDAFAFLATEKGRKRLENEFQQFVHSVNHLSRSASESPFTNVSIFDEVKIHHIVENDLAWYYDGMDRKEVINLIIELQKQFLNFFNKGDPTKGGMPYRFPVVTINLSKQKNEKGEWEVCCPDFLNYVTSELDIYRYNIFTSEGSKVASCCRLLNNSELLDLASQVNSFGAGATGNIGAHRVVTINFNRIALECKSYEDYLNILNSRMDDTRKILKAHKRLILDLASGGLQSFISNGWVNPNRLFSVFGEMGLVEAQQTLRRKFGKENLPEDIIGESLVILDKYVRRATMEDNGFTYSIEQIPGESYAVRLASVDKVLYGEEEVPYELYANQWIPLWQEASIWEKLEADGKYNSLLTGGGIVHATIGEPVTPKQARKIIEYAVACGCEHFALNAIYSKCEDGHAHIGDLTTCPECGKKVTDKLTRVVGFFTPVSSWNKTRREWEFPRRTKVAMEE